MTTADNFKAKGIQQGHLEFYDFKNPSNSICSSAYVQLRSNKSLNSRHPWYFVMVSVHKTFQNSDAAQGKSYSFMPCRMVHLRHFETLEF